MMRATTLKAGGAGVAGLVGYYAGLAEDQLRRDGRTRGPIDYYLDPNEPPGRWWGDGSPAVELSGDVRPEHLEAMLQGGHPGQGGRLGRGFGAKSARAFDATFSAPKSVSVLWALSPDAAVRAAVLAAHDADRRSCSRLAGAARGSHPSGQKRRPSGRRQGIGGGAVPPTH